MSFGSPDCEVRRILLAIDQKPGGKPINEIDRLFEQLDNNRTGYLEGSEYARFLDNVADHLVVQFEEAGYPGYTRERLQPWLAEVVDPSGTRRISRSDLQSVLKQILDAPRDGQFAGGSPSPRPRPRPRHPRDGNLDLPYGRLTDADVRRALSSIGAHSANPVADIDKLFEQLDENNTGVLEGRESERFVDNVTAYLQKQFANGGYPGHSESFLRSWVERMLDSHCFPSICRVDLERNLKAVLDTPTEPRPDVAPKPPLYRDDDYLDYRKRGATDADVRRALYSIDRQNYNPVADIADLFQQLDGNGTGYLEGAEYDRLVDNLTGYLLHQFNAAGYSGHDESTLRSWVGRTLDSNNDRRISRTDMEKHLKIVLQAPADATQSGAGHSPPSSPAYKRPVAVNLPRGHLTDSDVRRALSSMTHGSITMADIDRLFDSLDENKTEYLEGEEYFRFIAIMSEFMLNQFQDAGHMNYDLSLTKQWVIQTLDVNLDGRVSRAEMRSNLQKTLNLRQ